MSLNKQTTITHNKLQKKKKKAPGKGKNLAIRLTTYYNIKNFQLFIKITKQIT